jgi:hypothetical protein
MEHGTRCISEQAEKDEAVEAAIAQEEEEQEEELFLMDRCDRAAAFEEKKRDRMTE